MKKIKKTLDFLKVYNLYYYMEVERLSYLFINFLFIYMTTNTFKVNLSLLRKIYFIYNNKPLKLQIEYPCCGWYLSMNLPEIQGTCEVSRLLGLMQGYKDKLALNRVDGVYVATAEQEKALVDFKALCFELENIVNGLDNSFLEQEDDALLELMNLETLIVLKHLKEQGYKGINQDILKKIGSYERPLTTVKIGDMEFLVGTEEEAEHYARDMLADSFTELNGINQNTFDRIEHYIDLDRWVDDCLMDGLGYHISGYDGLEHDIKVNGEYYKLFRTN